MIKPIRILTNKTFNSKQFIIYFICDDFVSLATEAATSEASTTAAASTAASSTAASSTAEQSTTAAAAAATTAVSIYNKSKV